MAETVIPGRYLVFAGLSYYPGMGVEDLKMVTDDRQRAIDTAQDACISGSAYAKEHGTSDWAHVFDTFAVEVVKVVGDRAHFTSFNPTN